MVVVPGGKPIIFFTILALIDEGDEVIYPNPGFPIYESMIHYVGGKAVPIQLREDHDFSLDVNELAALITDRTKLIISEFAPKSYWRRDATERRGAGGEDHWRPQHSGVIGRDLQPAAF